MKSDISRQKEWTHGSYMLFGGMFRIGYKILHNNVNMAKSEGGQYFGRVMYFCEGALNL